MWNWQNLTDKKLIELVVEHSILFKFSNRFYYDQLKKDNLWDGKSLQSSSWYAEKRIMNSDAEGLSEFSADSSNSIPIWCAAALTERNLSHPRRTMSARKHIRQFCDNLPPPQFTPQVFHPVPLSTVYLLRRFDALDTINNFEILNILAFHYSTKSVNVYYSKVIYSILSIKSSK